MKVERVGIGSVSPHNPLDFRKRTFTFTEWYVIGDTVGTFAGRNIRWSARPVWPAVQTAFPEAPYRIEIGGGRIRMGGLPGDPDIWRFRTVIHRSGPPAGTD